MDPKVVSHENGMHRCPFPGCDFKASSAAVNKHVTETHSLQLFSIITELRAELQEEKKTRHGGSGVLKTSTSKWLLFN